MGNGTVATVTDAVAVLPPTPTATDAVAVLPPTAADTVALSPTAATDDAVAVALAAARIAVNRRYRHTKQGTYQPEGCQSHKLIEPKWLQMMDLPTGRLPELRILPSLRIGNRNYNFNFVFWPVSGRTWPRDPFNQVGLEKWCRNQPKLALETNSRAVS